MILIVDAGNTNVDVSIYENDVIIYQERIETKRENINVYYRGFFNVVKGHYPSIEGFIVSSVVPLITSLIYNILRDNYQMEGLLLNRALVTDLVVKLANPDELGADLIATTYGAISKYQTPIIVADLGTATKISVINEHKEFLGGIIVPGVSISKKAMEMMIPHLPIIEPKLPATIMTQDTIQSMQSGLLYGTIYQVIGLVAAIEEELDIKATKILTGGYSRFIKHKMAEFIYDENLLNEGLLAIYKKYHRTKT